MRDKPDLTAGYERVSPATEVNPREKIAQSPGFDFVDTRGGALEHVTIRYDVADITEHVLVIDAASKATRYQMVVTRLAEHHRDGLDRFVIALVNLDRGYVWNLPQLHDWHWSYLVGGRDLNEITGRTIAQILEDVHLAFGW